MQKEAFRVFLDGRYPNRVTASQYVTDLGTAERRIGNDIDEYLADDMDRPLPEHCKAADRTAVNLYRVFLRSVDAGTGNGERSDAETLSERDRFSLEADLQRALRINLGQLAPDLRVADEGSERSVATGRIDILARDSGEVWWVIELKAGTANDRAVSQLASYMGALGEKEGGEIRGILVAHDFTRKARYAARAIPGIELKRYDFSFTFEDHE